MVVPKCSSKLGIKASMPFSRICKSFHGLHVGSQNHIKLTQRISVFSVKGEVDSARKIFDEMPYRDVVASNVMIRCYIENHRIAEARELFDRTHERTTVSWNSMIRGYMQERKTHIALKLFLVMPNEDVISWTTAITGLCKNSRIADAWKVFEKMPEPNSISWSSIISGFQQNGLPGEALNLFKTMLFDGFQPTCHSFTSALAASGDLAALSIGQQLYCQILKLGFENNTKVGNSAISMFMKCGSFNNAWWVFMGMLKPDLITWNSLIVGCGQHGYGVEALMIFHQMQKACFLPDEISFLGVLQGCVHCGFVLEAMKSIRIMKMDYNISPGPEHYACLVDVLGRSGLLKEAFGVIKKMPFEPCAIFWRILLNGCRIWGGLELGVFAADRILELEPYNTSACLMVIEMYSSVGRWNKVEEIRKLTRERGATKELGHSWIEVQGDVHMFTTRDETHSESDSIYNSLNFLSCDISEHFGTDHIDW